MRVIRSRSTVPALLWTALNRDFVFLAAHWLAVGEIVQTSTGVLKYYSAVFSATGTGHIQCLYHTLSGRIIQGAIVDDYFA
jgi:hypothetical protein